MTLFGGWNEHWSSITKMFTIFIDTQFLVFVGWMVEKMANIFVGELIECDRCELKLLR